MRGKAPQVKAPTIVKNKSMLPSQPVAPIVKPIQSFQDTETAEYKLVRGIYSCKYCDGIFRTGSSTSMNAHLIEYHLKQKAEVPKPEPKYGQDEHEGEKISQTAQQSASQFVTEDKEEVRTTMPQTPVVEPEVPEVKEVQFACQKPGCGKVFKTQKALRMHETRMHK
jgi:hypothetical protein